jgi:hypothetical protein
LLPCYLTITPRSALALSGGTELIAVTSVVGGVISQQIIGAIAAKVRRQRRDGENHRPHADSHRTSPCPTPSFSTDLPAAVAWRTCAQCPPRRRHARRARRSRRLPTLRPWRSIEGRDCFVAHVASFKRKHAVRAADCTRQPSFDLQTVYWPLRSGGLAPHSLNTSSASRTGTCESATFLRRASVWLRRS